MEVSNDPEFVVKFIRRVKSMPLLYNQDDEHFRNINIKQQAWRQIAQEFNQDANWCMKKWISLRDYFVKRKKLLRLGKPARPWMYYNELRFLNVIYGEDNRIDFCQNESMTGSIDENSESYGKSEEVQAYNGSSTSERHNNNSNKLLMEEIDPEPDVQIYDYEQVEFNEDGEQDNSTVEEEHQAPTVINTRSNLSIVPIPINQNHNAPARNAYRKRRKITASSDYHQDIKDESPEITTADNCQVSMTEEDSTESARNPSHWQNQHHHNSTANRSPKVVVEHKQADAYDLFCQSVAAQMRNMSRDKALGLQVKIMKLIYECEFPEQSKE